MVRFKMVKETDKEEIYEYYPEDSRFKGILSKDKKSGKVKLVKKAKNDSWVIITKEMDQESIDNWNLSRKEDGLRPIKRKAKEMKWLRYAEHAVTAIERGEKEGIAMWY